MSHYMELEGYNLETVPTSIFVNYFVNTAPFPLIKFAQDTKTCSVLNKENRQFVKSNYPIKRQH